MLRKLLLSLVLTAAPLFVQAADAKSDGKEALNAIEKDTNATIRVKKRCPTGACSSGRSHNSGKNRRNHGQKQKQQQQQADLVAPVNIVKVRVDGRRDDEGCCVGPQGPQGIPGPQGPQGSQGVAGAKGAAGADGAKGSPGTRGPRGPRGSKGNDGRDGRTEAFGYFYSDVAQTVAPSTAVVFGHFSERRLPIDAATNTTVTIERTGWYSANYIVYSSTTGASTLSSQFVLTQNGMNVAGSIYAEDHTGSPFGEVVGQTLFFAHRGDLIQLRNANALFAVSIVSPFNPPAIGSGFIAGGVSASLLLEEIFPVRDDCSSSSSSDCCSESSSSSSSCSSSSSSSSCSSSSSSSSCSSSDFSSSSFSL